MNHAVSRKMRDATTVSADGDKTASAIALMNGSNEGQSPRLFVNTAET